MSYKFFYTMKNGSSIDLTLVLLKIKLIIKNVINYKMKIFL